MFVKLFYIKLSEIVLQSKLTSLLTYNRERTSLPCISVAQVITAAVKKSHLKVFARSQVVFQDTQ